MSDDPARRAEVLEQLEAVLRTIPGVRVDDHVYGWQLYDATTNERIFGLELL